MILGTDTGFFIAHRERHPRALELWQDVLNGAHELVLSTLSIHELFVFLYKRGLNQQAQTWLDLLAQSERITVVPVTTEIATQSARYRIGLRLSTVDSIILTTCVLQQCDLLLTTDSDLQIAAQQNFIPVEIFT